VPETKLAAPDTENKKTMIETTMVLMDKGYAPS
jgi:hypothetical protein